MPLFALALFLAAGFSTVSELRAQTGFGSADKRRAALAGKLAAIRLDTFKSDNLPLSEVIKHLSAEAKSRDPEKRGVNFLLNSNVQGASPANNQASGGPGAVPADIGELPIRIPPMTDISLEEALKLIVKVAGPPHLKYANEGYAVILYPSGEALPLSVRVFKVDPNTFQQGLHSVVGVPFGNLGGGTGTGGGGQAGQSAVQVTVPRVQVVPGPQGGIPSVTRTNAMDSVQDSVRSFFQGLGVDMTPPKSAVFNDRQGTLIVRATEADLELIAAALGR